MGRHSRKGTQAKGPDTEPVAGAGDGRRRRPPAAPAAGGGHAPFDDVPQVRGGHPEQREPGGGWGTGPQQRYGDWQGGGRPGPSGPAPAQLGYAQQAVARQMQAQQMSAQQMSGRQMSGRQQAAQRAVGRGAAAPSPTVGGPPLIPGPRREFVEAFETARPEPHAEPRGGPHGPPGAPPGPPTDAEPDDEAGRRESRGGKGRAFTGIAAAAVTTVLAVVVAGQVAQSHAPGTPRTSGVDRNGGQDTSRSEDRPAPQAQDAQDAQVKPLSYEAKMARVYPFEPKLKASGEFEAVPGLAKAPGKGHRYRYRIDVEKGLGLDAGLFAEAVQKTLNDNRSWAHNGAMTFERISSGKADFVITLASPGTTAALCEKSGLDTTEDNVSCDSAATPRVVINAFRWAQGSSTFGPEKILAYRQMLINHEVGHRLGHNHVSCRTPGALAPVMQQQTKTLDIDGIKCRPNPWVYPTG